MGENKTHNDLALCGPILVSSTGDADCSEKVSLVSNLGLIRTHKGCCLLKIAGRWPWRLESA